MSQRSGTEHLFLALQAWRLAARLLRERCQRLRAEVSRLDTLWGETISQRDHWQWEAQRRIYARKELADLLGTEDIEEAVEVVRRIRTWAARWKAVAHRHRSHVRGLTMRWVTNLTGRVRAEMEVARLQTSLDAANACCNRIQADLNAKEDEMSGWRQEAMLLRERCRKLEGALDNANERCNRIQADGNALAEQLHAWRQACQDHGIEATPEALRAVLRRVDAACVTGADL